MTEIVFDQVLNVVSPLITAKIYEFHCGWGLWMWMWIQWILIICWPITQWESLKRWTTRGVRFAMVRQILDFLF